MSERFLFCSISGGKVGDSIIRRITVIVRRKVRFFFYGSRIVIGAKWKISVRLLIMGVLFLPVGCVFLTGCGKGAGEREGGLRDMVDVAASGGAIIIHMETAEELPDTPSILFGIVDHCQDNSVFVTQLPPLDQIIEQGAAEKGPVIEVVVVKDTIVYRDVTSGSAKNGIVQGEVALGLVDEIEGGNLILVWGDQRGDRVVADVLAYNNHSQLMLPSGPVN
jgi:hypothetical protein